MTRRNSSLSSGPAGSSDSGSVGSLWLQLVLLLILGSHLPLFFLL